jgi:hypothetical protein
MKLSQKLHKTGSSNVGNGSGLHSSRHQTTHEPNLLLGSKGRGFGVEARNLLDLTNPTPHRAIQSLEEFGVGCFGAKISYLCFTALGLSLLTATSNIMNPQKHDREHIDCQDCQQHTRSTA